MKLTLIRGIPGSGKTTLAHKLIGENDVIMEADHFFQKPSGYNYNIKLIREAHMWCQSCTAYHLFRGRNVIVSNTSIHFRDLECYYDIAKKFNAEFEIINCTGDYKNIHDVPEETLNIMANNFIEISTEDFIKKLEENNS